MTRPIRPAPHIFQGFPESAICPVCQTNDDGPTLLVQIDWTNKGGISEGKPVHLACAIPTNYTSNPFEVLYRKPKRYRNELGPCREDDPKRLLWYGANCAFWTDDWNSIDKAGPGIPCCPHCGSVGFQITAQEWFDQARRYEARGHRAYVKVVEHLKGKCFGRLTLVQLYKAGHEGGYGSLTNSEGNGDTGPGQQG